MNLQWGDKGIEPRDLCKDCGLRKRCGLALVIDGLGEMGLFEEPEIWVVSCNDYRFTKGKEEPNER